MKPRLMPNLSSRTLAVVARQLVVHEALLMMRCLAGSYCFSLTPSTTVTSGSLAGAVMMTFLAPAPMCARGGGVPEDAGGLHDHVHAELLPRQRRRVLDRAHPDLAPVDEDGLALGGDVGLEVAVDGIVLQEVRQGLGIGEVVDADHLDLAVRLERGAEEDAPDAAESVDADSNTHERAPCAGERYRVPGISRNYTATYNTRATVSTPTERAPTACSARAHSPAVAPVVSTSSTSTTSAPAAVVEATNAPLTLARRAAASSSVWGAVARGRASQRGDSGAPSPRATCSATSAAWLKPRSRSRSRASGMDTSTAPAGIAAAHCSSTRAASGRASAGRRPNFSRCTASRSGPA